jgi:hypothetical protein
LEDKKYIFLQSTRCILYRFSEMGCMQEHCSEHPRRPPKRPIPFPRFPPSLNIEIRLDDPLRGKKITARRLILPSVPLADMWLQGRENNCG